MSHAARKKENGVRVIVKMRKIFLGTALVIESRYNHKGKQLR